MRHSICLMLLSLNVLYVFISMNELNVKATQTHSYGGEGVLPAKHTRTIFAFTPQPQSITALWLVLIEPTHVGMTRLS